MLKTWRRRLATAFLLLLVMLAALAAYVWMERARLAETVLTRVLVDRGVEPVSFRVGLIGFRSVSLHDIRVGGENSPDLSVDQLTVTYEAGELLSGRVRSVDMGEVRARIHYSEDGVSLGALDPLLSRGGSGSSSSIQLPPVNVEKAEILLETQHGTFLMTGPLNVMAGDDGATLASLAALRIDEVSLPARVAPLLLSGDIRLHEEMLTFEAALSSLALDTHLPLLAVEGNYDISSRKGAATGTGIISFARNGLQPADLSPLLGGLPVDMSGGLSYQASVALTEKDAVLEAEIEPQKMHLAHAQTGNTSLAGKLRLKGVLALDGDEAGITYEAKVVALRFDDLERPLRFSPFFIEGDVNGDDRRADICLALRSSLSAIHGARLSDVTGTYDLDTNKGTFRATGNLALAPGKLELQTVLPLLRGVVTRMSGQADYSTNISLDAGEVKGAGQATFKNLGFTTSVATVEQLSGTVSFSDFLPLRTKGVQTLRVGKLQAGLPLENGVIAFEMNKDGARLVDASWPFAGGKLVLISTEVAESLSDAGFLLTIENVDLASLLLLVDVPGLSATGHISGRVPVAFRNGDPLLLNGKISSQENGVIVYEGSASDMAPGEQTQLLTNALKNFHYTELSGGVSGNANGDMTLGVSLKGANPDLYDGYPFAINVTLEGSLADVARRATVGLRPFELLRENDSPVVTPPAEKMEP